MRKYSWAILAVVCVMAVVLVMAILLPRLFLGTNLKSDAVELLPGHWWKAELTQQQLGVLSGLWGNDLTASGLVQTLWPDALGQMPEEAISAYERQLVEWPTGDYGDWQGEMMAGGIAAPHDNDTVIYYYYVGSRESERITFLTSPDRGFTEDRMYRVSMYVELPQGGVDDDASGTEKPDAKEPATQAWQPQVQQASQRRDRVERLESPLQRLFKRWSYSTAFVTQFEPSC